VACDVKRNQRSAIATVIEAKRQRRRYRLITAICAHQPEAARGRECQSGSAIGLKQGRRIHDDLLLVSRNRQDLIALV
jgi:hypothetical protein